MKGVDGGAEGSLSFLGSLRLGVITGQRSTPLTFSFNLHVYFL